MHSAVGLGHVHIWCVGGVYIVRPSRQKSMIPEILVGLALVTDFNRKVIEKKYT